MDYGGQAARWLLGASAHPGGLELSRRLIERLALPPRSQVADIACGRGATVRLLADRGHTALGIDLAPGRASAAAASVAGEAHALPVSSTALDAVVCECALSTFDRPRVALGEMRRVLRPGGVLGITDVLLDRDRAGADVCRAVDRLTTARPLASYAGLLTDAGFRVTAAEDCRWAAAALLGRLRRRLPLSSVVRECARAVSEGSLGYGLLVARIS